MLASKSYCALSSAVLHYVQVQALAAVAVSMRAIPGFTFFAVLDSFSTRGHGKKFPVKIFEVCVEILGVLYFG